MKLSRSVYVWTSNVFLNSNTPFTRYNRLYNWFDNRLYCVNRHPTVCSFNWLSNRVVQPVSQPCWTNSTVRSTGCQSWFDNWLNEQLLFNRLSNHVVKPVSQPAIYTIQPFVKPVVKRVWQPVQCLYTQYNRLSNQFDNRFDNQLYCVYKHLPGCQTGLRTGCIV